MVELELLGANGSRSPWPRHSFCRRLSGDLHKAGAEPCTRAGVVPTIRRPRPGRHAHNSTARWAVKPNRPTKEHDWFAVRPTRGISRGYSHVVHMWHTAAPPTAGRLRMAGCEAQWSISC